MLTPFHPKRYRQIIIAGISSLTIFQVHASELLGARVYTQLGAIASESTNVMRNGSNTTAQYDTDGNPLTTQDPNENTLNNQYNGFGAITQTTAIGGGTVTKTYDPQTHVLASESNAAGATSNAYRLDGSLVTQTQTHVDSVVQTYTYQYNTNGCNRHTSHS